MEEKTTLTVKELQASANKLTDKMLSDLTTGFNNDFTVEECCRYAGISKETYYQWLKLSDEFAGMMDRAKDFVFIAAKRNLVKSINNGDNEASKWYLSKRQKALFADRTEYTGADGEKLELGVVIMPSKVDNE